jgi:hypothetical protein
MFAAILVVCSVETNDCTATSHVQVFEELSTCQQEIINGKEFFTQENFSYVDAAFCVKIPEGDPA